MRGQALLHDEKFARDLGRFLKSQRKDAGLSQKVVGKKLGYTSPQFVSNWERGKVLPPLNTIALVTKIYRIDPGEITELILSHFRRIIQGELDQCHVTKGEQKGKVPIA